MSKTGKPGPESVETLDRSPSHLLHRALQLALDFYAEEAAAGAPTQRQYAVLSAVAAQEGRTQTELVRATGIDRSTLADLVARMIGKDLLARERSSSDGRANAVHLSEAGRAALAAAAPGVASADSRLLGVLSKSKRDPFLAALRQLAKSGDKALAKAEKAAAKGDAAPSANGDAPPKPKKSGKGKKKAAKLKKAAPEA
ncbi:MAG TPA: MarR family transcriptional regulator [Caulobacteraceae bacterium]|nr:MarR family transcriptional regulator [Caulobacteraceae bacterium]